MFETASQGDGADVENWPMEWVASSEVDVVAGSGVWRTCTGGTLFHDALPVWMIYSQ